MNCKLVQIALAATLLVGCANPKAANERNFVEAVDAYLLSQKAKGEFCLGQRAYPASSSPGTANGDDALERLGYLTVTGQWSTMLSRGNTYALTPKGQGHFTAGWGFCFGTPKVTRIITFSEPSVFGPYTMSEVRYEYRIADIPDWARDESFRWKIKPQIEDSATLILTNHGWVHETLLSER